MTTVVHGDSAFDRRATGESEIMFGGGLDGVSEAVFQDVVGEIPTVRSGTRRLEGAGLALVDVIVHSGLTPSKGQARKDVEGGGIYLNNVRVAEVARQRLVTTNDLLFGKYLLLRKGKRTYTVLRAV
jgi:tyrosyl-tRNA synthetase